MNKIILLSLLTFFIPHFGNAQSSNSNIKKNNVHKIFSESIYLEDLNQLVDSIKFNHPQSFEFITKEAFKDLIEKKKESITDSTTIGEFVWLCQSVMAAIGCGHTAVSIENTLELVPSIFFPMAANYVDRRLYVIDPLLNEASVAQGTEILSINGIDVGSLRDKMRANIPSDGYIRSIQDLYINNYFRAYCAFQLGFPPIYRIVIREENNTKEIILNASDQKTSKENHLSNCKDNLCFEVDSSNSLAILTIRSFIYYDANFLEFKSFIDNSFAKLHLLNLDNLVIDLRNNGGGDPFCASYLLQHISNQPFRYYKAGSTVWYKELEKMIPIDVNKFTGKLFILTNGGCFSTSGHLISLIKALNIGILIGQETGATYSCNANTKTFLLKNTSIFASVATKTYQTDVEGFVKNEGIIPDYQIKAKLSDVINDSDLEMEKVIHLIKKK